jgi:hypothetical protein
MRVNLRTSNLIVIFIAAVASLFLWGCAEMGSTNTKSLLSAAGFHVRTPQTPLQKEVYTALPAYRVERVSEGNKVLYVYKDEGEGVAYVGREPEYQRYKQLAIQQQIAQDYYMASQWNGYYSHRWYGAWGPRYWY